MHIMVQRRGQCCHAAPRESRSTMAAVPLCR